LTSFYTSTKQEEAEMGLKAANNYHFYEPVLGHGLPHDPFNAIVGPRPIGWISTRDANGIANLAPYSFFNAFNYTPPIVGFSSIGPKDSLLNIRETGVFGWNLTTRPLADQMNASSAAAPKGIDEFKLAGLSALPGRVLDVPLVEQSPVRFECRCTQIVQLETIDGDAIQTWMVLGEVVGVHIDKALLCDGVYDTAAAHPVLRGGGMVDYFEISSDAYFQMHRPRYPESV
jgi:flavin reductase (DIM6/NTAB) family NADH-FMN oxidoreductase RutF